MFKFYVSGQYMGRKDSTSVVSGSADYLTAKVEFSEDWNGYAKTVYFNKPDIEVPFQTDLDIDDEIKADQHLNLTDGLWDVYIHGQLGTSEITTNSIQIYVAPCDITDGEPFPIKPPTFGQWVKEKLDWLLGIFKVDGDGTKFLSDDGTYKEVQGGGGGSYTLPTMSADIKGGAKLGAHLEIIEETLNVVDIIIEETDPTVPLWAKQPAKPAYNKSDVGLGNVDNTSDADKPISDAVQTALDGKINNGDISLWAKQPTKPTYSKSEVGLGNVDNTSDANKPISTAVQTALDGKVNNSKIGATNGVAQLDENGRVPASQIPGAVDEVIEGFLYLGVFYQDHTHLIVITGESGKIYSDLYSDKLFRWSGSLYAEISASLALGETASTAFAGDKGKQVRDDLADHIGGGGVSHALVTDTDAGFMSPEEHNKLAGVAENANNYTLTNQLLSSVLSSAMATAIVDSDTIPFSDTSNLGLTKKITVSNLFAVLKTYFDTIYTVISSGNTIADATTLSINLSKYPTVKKTATLTTCTSLTITLPSGANWYDEYMLYFTTGSVAPVIAWPIEITEWVGGEPTFSANKTYVISIQNGIGVVANV